MKKLLVGVLTIPGIGAERLMGVQRENLSAARETGDEEPVHPGSCKEFRKTGAELARGGPP